MAIYIKEIRKKRGIPQKILAEKLGVAPSYIARIESGERVLTNEWVIKLTKALNCEPWELSDDTDYIFSRENLQKLFKKSISIMGGDNSNFQNIAVDHSNQSFSSTNGNPFENDLIKIFREMDSFKQAKLLLLAKEMSETSTTKDGE